MTVISGRVHRDNLDRFYPLLIDAIREPAFRQDDLDRIKSQTLNYLENTLRYSSDEELGKAVLYNTIFAGTPYWPSAPGNGRGRESITLDDVRQFYRMYYHRRTSCSASAAAMTMLGRPDCSTIWRSSRRVREPSDPSARAGARPRRQVTIVEKDCSPRPSAWASRIDVHRGEKDWYALAVANSGSGSTGTRTAIFTR